MTRKSQKQEIQIPDTLLTTNRNSNNYKTTGTLRGPSILHFDSEAISASAFTYLLHKPQEGASSVSSYSNLGRYSNPIVQRH